jgi:hypothetical protein
MYIQKNISRTIFTQTGKSDSHKRIRNYHRRNRAIVLRFPDLHPDPKKRKEYFLEFLMIFLSVTVGFFAETIRESISAAAGSAA